jgi:hypothetical protein
MGDANRRNLPFVDLACGRFAPSQVRVALTDVPRPSTPELEAAIAEQWERQTALAREHDRLLFNGDLLRYVGHRISNGGASCQLFELTVGPTCYRDFVGTNLFNHHRIDEFGHDRFANPVGTTATLMTADRRICYGRRSQRVSYHAGCVHTFGGALEASDRGDDEAIDAFVSVARELTEELAIAPDELHDFTCVGLIRDREIHQPELLFEARLPITADALRTRWQSADAKDEHVDIVTLADAPDAIVPFIKSCGLIAPVAVGALLLHGRLTWGEPWFHAAAAQL